MTYKITTYKKTTLANQLTIDEFKEVDFEELAVEICKVPWSPAHFLDDTKRTKSNFQASNLLVFDVDAGCTISHAKTLFKDHACIIATTKSHQKEKVKDSGTAEPPCDRFRIIIPFNKTIDNVKDLEATLAYYHEQYPFVDPACKDGARFYWPCTQVVHIQAGKKIDAAKQYDRINAIKNKLLQFNNKQTAQKTKALDINLLKEEKGGRNNALTAYAGMIWGRSCKTYDEIETALLKKNNELIEPLPEKEVLLIAAQASKFAPNNNAWKDDLIKNKEGQISNCIKNVNHTLLNMFDIKLDVRSQKVYVDSIEYSDINLHKIRTAIAEELNVDYFKTNVEDALMAIAHDNQFDPVFELMNNTKWDGVKRLDNIATKYFGTNNELYDVYLKKFLISAVARTFEPGCKVDTCLILAGKQGWLKSTALQTLALKPEYFNDNLSTNKNEKDRKSGLLGHLIIELAELSKIDLANTDDVKQFISTQVDKFRPSYGRTDREFKRRCVFSGTTNRKSFLRDETGNRRFWVVDLFGVERINIEALKKDVRQLYAEAVDAYKNKEVWWLNHEQEEEQNALNNTYQEEEPWHDDIVQFLSLGKTHFKTVDIYEYLFIEASKRDKKTSNSIARTLRTLGYEYSAKRVDGKKQKVWSKQ